VAKAIDVLNFTLLNGTHDAAKAIDVLNFTLLNGKIIRIMCSEEWRN